jgi:CheY-like chemotaxis protein
MVGPAPGRRWPPPVFGRIYLDVSSTSQLDESSKYSAFVRALNDDIAALGRSDHDDALRILCECSRSDCTTTLQITADEYRAVRADDTRFLMAPGHESTEEQRVVLRYGAVAVVEQRESWVESPPDAAGAARSRPLVLIVDDEPEIHETCVTCLQHSGAVVLGASDGQQGLDKARSLRPDLIVTDVSIPVLDGFRLAQALDLDDRTQDIPVIFLSGESGEDATGLELGGLTYVTKPLDPAVFTSVVTDVLARVAGVERDSAAA